MSLDGSVFYKPQIGPWYTEIDKARKEELIRKMYVQEHYLPIAKSGAVNMPASKEEYVNIVADALHNPGKYTKHNDDCLRTMLTYTDGKSTERAVAALKKFYSV